MSVTGSEKSGHVVIVLGAGPAGMALAKKMADVGHEVIILNRVAWDRYITCAVPFADVRREGLR